MGGRTPGRVTRAGSPGVPRSCRKLDLVLPADCKTESLRMVRRGSCISFSPGPTADPPDGRGYGAGRVATRSVCGSSERPQALLPSSPSPMRTATYAARERSGIRRAARRPARRGPLPSVSHPSVRRPRLALWDRSDAVARSGENVAHATGVRCASTTGRASRSRNGLPGASPHAAREACRGSAAPRVSCAAGQLRGGSARCSRIPSSGSTSMLGPIAYGAISYGS